MSTTRRGDVMVVGGGLIGAVAALALARTGLKVLLVERERPRTAPGSFGLDVRTVACSPASRSLLECVDAWESLTATPYRMMEVWEEQGTARLTFSAEEVGRTELGWILQNGPTLAVLWQRLEESQGIEIVLGTLEEVEAGSDRVIVAANGRRMSVRLLIGVDGARSTVRDLVNARVDSQDTRQQALATLVRTEQPHRGIALQRFLLDGPVALLPTARADVSSVVWSQSPENAARRQALTDEEFCLELEWAVERRPGRILEVDRRITFPLSQQLVADFNPLSRVLLIGDAARVLHPLAGLGANVGFEDVRDLLARVRSLPRGADIGAPGVWRAFARKRRTRARLMLGAMASFKSIYGDGEPFRQWLRNAAIGWLNDAGPLKQQLIREALGLGPLASRW